MTNEELKKKIVEILKEGQTPVEYDSGDCGQTYFPTNEDVADALIAAGIGDVSELQKECDSKEEAYNKCYFDFKHWKDKAKEYKHRTEVAEMALLTACVNLIKDEEDNVNMELLARVVYTNYLRKAEKELAEEKKDD